jgi:hypothetical protein
LKKIDPLFLRGYSTIQQRLLEEISANYSIEKYLSSVPKNGEVFVNSAQWIYKKHGAGIRFTNSDGVVVDAHTICQDALGAFDAWRILLYAESLGLSDLDEREVSSILASLRDKGFLVFTSEEKCYVLAGRQKKIQHP